MSLFMDLLQVGKIVDEAQLNATTNWDSTTQHKYTVPAGRRAFFICGFVSRSDAATAQMTAVRSDAKVLAHFGSHSSATGGCGFPTNQSNYFNPSYPLILEAGDYIQLTCGAAQGATAYVVIRVIEVDIS